MAFKTQKQQSKIAANIANDIKSINNLANYKAQIIQTLSANLTHIQDNHKLLYKLDLWTQAAVHQTTGFRLAQKVLKYSPQAVLKWSEQRLNVAINKAKPHSSLLPTAINSQAISNNASQLKTPIAIDLISSHGVDSQALEIFDQSARGNANSRSVVTMYVSEDAARATQNINQDISRQVAQLNSDLDPISGQYQQLERSSAGKAALVSAGIGLFQLRSMWMGKSSITTMANRGDRDALEFTTSYASSTMALTAASLDVVNAGMQMRVARSAWIARLSLGAGVLGTVGAGFEVYSLNISREKHIDNKSGISEAATGVAQVAAVTAGVAGAMIGFGISLPFLGAIVAVAWGVSLIAQWVAFRYDKSHILPIHYWLDAGVFGNKTMLNDDYPNNPFKIRAMQNLEEDLHAYALAMTEFTVTPKFDTGIRGNESILKGVLTISISQWQENSWLGIACYIQKENGDIISLTGKFNSSSRITRLIETGEARREGNRLIITKELPQIKKRVYVDHSYLGYNINSSIEALSKQETPDSDYIIVDDIDRLETIVNFTLDADAHPTYELSNTIKSN